MTDETIDLTNCDREPIHIPGLIEPHGVLLVLQDPTLEILQVSSNTQEVVGRQPEELLGKPLSDLHSLVSSRGVSNRELGWQPQQTCGSFFRWQFANVSSQILCIMARNGARVCPAVETLRN